MGNWTNIPKHLRDSDKPFYTLDWIVRMWNKDSHGLFDYHTTNYHCDMIEVIGNSFIYANLSDWGNMNVESVGPLCGPEDYTLNKILSVAYK